MQFRIGALAVAVVLVWLPACDAEREAAPRKTGEGVPPVVEKIYAPTDLAGLREKLNRRVVVEGKITGTGQSNTGSVRYLNFTANYRDSVSLVLLTGRDRKEFPEEKVREFIGRKVHVGGLLSERNGALQIRVFELEHIKVLP